MHVNYISFSDVNFNVFSFQGQGFSYSDGEYLDDIDGYFSEIFHSSIDNEKIKNGETQITILTEDEYKNEVNNMIEFIKRTYKC